MSEQTDFLEGLVVSENGSGRVRIRLNEIYRFETDDGVRYTLQEFLIRRTRINAYISGESVRLPRDVLNGYINEKSGLKVRGASAGTVVDVMLEEWRNEEVK